MTTSSFARLILLAAIWGSSFLFMRIGVAELGPVRLIAGRVALAALFLFVVGFVQRKNYSLWSDWRHFGVLGLFNSALPFLLFGIAANTLSASLLSIMNATAPVWGAIIAAVWYRRALSIKTVIGLALGLIGVAILVGVDSFNGQPGTAVALACAIGAAVSYGIATVYTQAAKKVDAFSNAYGSLLTATLLIVPVAPFFAAPATVSTSVLMAVLALGVLCSGIAYLLYFRLVDDVGAAGALTVTFLIPVFGILWGHLFLGEPVGWRTGVGAIVVLIGTALVTGFSPATLRQKVA